jgi:hypothetical protein
VFVVLKTELHAVLKAARAANLSTLEGLGEFDLRRPATATGTNLLGVVKHLGGMEYGYLGETFGRYLARSVPGDEDPENLGDMWATADESLSDILAWYRQACDHADATIHALELDDVGSVPHWSDPNQVTLGQMMLRVLGEELRHGGHLDIVRELVGGTVSPVTPARSQRWWAAHTARLQGLADSFR